MKTSKIHSQGTLKDLEKKFSFTHLPSDVDVGFSDVMPSVSGDSFDSPEHDFIGNKAFVDFLDELHTKGDKLRQNLILSEMYDPLSRKLQVTSNLSLTPGWIVFLAGDFYGLPDEPIALGETRKDQETRFRGAYETLIGANAQELHKLTLEIAKKTQILREELIQGHMINPSRRLDNSDRGTDYNYSLITRYTFFPIPYVFNRYADLAVMNFDHFGNEARIAYEVGHQIALKTALEANAEKDESCKHEKLITAFSQVLFACHYLTDLFAAGHIRTPRKALKDYLDACPSIPSQTAKRYVSGYFAKVMHDEDNVVGLRVDSPSYPKGWDAFGDNCFFNIENGENAKRTIEAVKIALGDVYHTYCTGEYSFLYKEYLPVPSLNKNHAPLFKVNEAGQVGVRADLQNLNCASDNYTYDWSPTSVIKELKCTYTPINIKEHRRRGAYAQLMDKEIRDYLDKLDKELGAFLSQPAERQGNYCVLI